MDYANMLTPEVLSTPLIVLLTYFLFTSLQVLNNFKALIFFVNVYYKVDISIPLKPPAYFQDNKR